MTMRERQRQSSIEKAENCGCELDERQGILVGRGRTLVGRGLTLIRLIPSFNWPLLMSRVAVISATVRGTPSCLAARYLMAAERAKAVGLATKAVEHTRQRRASHSEAMSSPSTLFRRG